MSHSLTKLLRIYASLCIVMILVALLTVLVSLFSPAHATTAIFSSPDDVITDADVQRMTSVNSQGYLIGRGDTLLVELAENFATNTGDDMVTLYYNNRNRAWRNIGIQVGYEVNGVIEWSSIRRFWTRGTGSIDFTGFSDHCSVAGGCSFISLTAGNWGRGYSVDAIAVNSELITGTTATTPEPSTWAMMIVAFLIIAIFLKYLRRAGRLAWQVKPQRA